MFEPAATPAGGALARATERLAQQIMDGPVGVDAVHIPTWQRYIELTGEPLLRCTYRPGELAFAANRPDRLATRLAAKEAVLKVLGTGIRGVGLRDIEVVTAPEGKPTVRLHGPGAERARDLRLGSIEISLTHEGDYALAVAAGRSKAQ